MFQKLFALPMTIAKHQQGPMAEGRRRYLARLAEGGAVTHTLRVEAHYLLAVASRMGITPDKKVSLKEINREAGAWAHRSRPHGAKAGISGPRDRFSSVARRWLGFLDQLVVPIQSQSWDHLVRDFAEHMEKEQGGNHDCHAVLVCSAVYVQVRRSPSCLHRG